MIYLPHQFSVREKPTRAEKGKNIVSMVELRDKWAKPKLVHKRKTSPKSRRPSMSVGWEIMRKIGYKEGQGLGPEGKGRKEPVQAYDREGKGGLGFDQFPDEQPLQWNLQKHFTSIGIFNPNTSPLGNIILAKPTKFTLPSEEDLADEYISSLFQTLELPAEPLEGQTVTELPVEPPEGQTAIELPVEPPEGQTAIGIPPLELPAEPLEGQTATVLPAEPPEG